MSGTTQIDHLFQMCKELKSCSPRTVAQCENAPCPTTPEKLAQSPEPKLDRKAQALKELRENARRRRSRFAH